MRRYLVFVVCFCIPYVGYGECPVGYTAFMGPGTDLVRDANGNCSQVCGADITTLATSNGYNFDLFATKNTSRAISIKFGETVCYADLIDGTTTGTINVQYGDRVYHTNPSYGYLCPSRYTLTYDCADDAVGTAPEAREINWGDLYSPPYDAKLCRRPGYSFNGWSIDSQPLTQGKVYAYEYDTDKTMVAQWVANMYGGPVLCNYCPGSTYTNSTYISGTFNDEFTPLASLSCTNPANQTLMYYRVLDAWGNDTGEVVYPGEATTWVWPGNIRLNAVWSDSSYEQLPTYTLSYSCGDGAQGTPPESREMRYNIFYIAPYSAGTCTKQGHYLKGWKIDSTSLTKGSVYNYKYTTDKTMVAQWAKNTYGGAYLCNNGTDSTDYLSATYGSTETVSETACDNGDGASPVGWQILDAWGNDTGDFIGGGSTFTWNYPYNIQLLAVWE